MYDRQKADIILDVPNSAAALAVATQAKNKKKLYINIGAGTTALTGDELQQVHLPLGVQHRASWRAARPARSPRPAARSWNIVYPDYAFGQDMNKSFTKEITAAGGTVGQSIASPFPSDNFATFITKAGEGNPDGHRLDARRWRPHQLRQAVQPELAQGQGAARRRPDVHHRHPLARRRPVRRHPVHRRLVLELRRAEQEVGRPLQGEDEHPSVLRPRRQLLGRDELPRGRPGGRHRRRRRRSSASSRARRSTTSSCATARSARPTTPSSTTSTSPRSRAPPRRSGTTRTSRRRSRPPRPTARPTPPAR